jgi:type IV pilus assembly protein PilM
MFVAQSSNYPIGLDISDLSLKLIQLNKFRDKITIQAISKIDLQPGIIERGEINNIEEFTKSINKLLNKPKFGFISSNNVVACLPETKTFVKLIEIEKNTNSLKNVIENEIEKHIPMLTKDIYYDWQIINEKAHSLEILIAAAPKKIVDSYIKCLKQTKLSVVALEIEASAICRCLLAEETPKIQKNIKNYAIIDIGAKRTSLIVYSKNTIVLSVSMPISGLEITNKIATTLEITDDQAEKAKILCGLDKDKAKGIIYDILSSNVNQLINKISNSFDFFLSQYNDRGKIDSILLCGGGTNIKDVDNIINQSLSIETKKANPLININVTDKKILENFIETYNLDIDFLGAKKNKSISIKQDSSLSYTTAFGLALRNIFIED